MSSAVRTFVVRGAIVLVVVIVLGITGFVTWSQANVYPATVEARTVAQQAERIRGWLVFRPTAPTQTGLIFYPGGLVEAEAYAPLLRELADRGILVVLTPKPLELAILSPNSANPVLTAFPEIKTWAIGGHSLGGAASAIYMQGHPHETDRIKGLVLWGARLNDSVDVRSLPIQALSIYGSDDGLAEGNLSESARALNLPARAELVLIDGGNHSMFGDYGQQQGDNPPRGDLAAMRREILDRTAAMVLGLR
jgi:pimeloyl-ACP methyl ester carboxylesterase